jgi:hypothetical protein
MIDAIVLLDKRIAGLINWKKNLKWIINVTDVTLHVIGYDVHDNLKQVATECWPYCATSHQVTKSIKKIEERRSGLTLW